MSSQLARQQQRHPPAHGGADPPLRAFAEPAKYREALFQPAPNITVDKIAAGFAVAGIVESDKGALVLGRPRIQRHRFGPQHVGFEATEPEKARRAAFADADSDAARRVC